VVIETCTKYPGVGLESRLLVLYLSSPHPQYPVLYRYCRSHAPQGPDLNLESGGSTYPKHGTIIYNNIVYAIVY
jgi:hypothetical protein